MFFVTEKLNNSNCRKIQQFLGRREATLRILEKRLKYALFIFSHCDKRCKSSFEHRVFIICVFPAIENSTFKNKKSNVKFQVAVNFEV